jgi:hypothetical protein
MSPKSPYKVNPEGIPLAFPSVGSICYNVKVGDWVTAFKADHVEPGVSIKNNEKGEGAYSPTFGLTFLACIGNRAKVVSGEAKGDTGTVIGKHGGIEHVMVHFSDETLEKLALGDKIQIKSWGQGLELLDFPTIKAMNIDPELLEKINLQAKSGKLKFPVTHIIPAKIMGSGLGSDNTLIGDYDIQYFDDKAVREYNLDTLRFGDFVAITDADHCYGRIYKEGAVSVGVVVHSICTNAGHGPGVTTILSSREGLILPVENEEANIGKWLGL